MQHNQPDHLSSIKDIKQMMERSSRFISLSGLSGIAAGICALVGAWFANDILKNAWSHEKVMEVIDSGYLDFRNKQMEFDLLRIGIITFISAFILSFLFTYLRSKKTNTPIWGTTAKRLLINVMIPLLSGGVFILKLIDFGIYGLFAPICLIFYGLALINASKYTLVEIRYLGFCELILGLVSLWFSNYGIYFWAFGFGILHIVYGIIMWYKYERVTE